jgi:SRSO17 transposase
MHQSLHHLVADAPWDDQQMLAAVRSQVLPGMQKQGPVVAWVLDDTGFPKQGKHSVGVGRQYCGQLGKRANCQVAVSLSVSTWQSSLPIAWRLYLPEDWCQDAARCQRAGVPEEVQFQTKTEIALQQVQQAQKDQIPEGVILADAGYGRSAAFRASLTEWNLGYMVGIELSTTFAMGEKSAASAKQLAKELPSRAWKNIGWRKGSSGAVLRSRFAAVRVTPAHGEDRQEQWLVIEWPKREAEPTKYWLSTMAAETSLKALVRMAKHRWVIERDYEELKQELGLGHFEGRSWRGFHHHAVLCIAAYGFLVNERSRFSPSARAGNVGLQRAEFPAGFRPRGAPVGSSGTA